MTSVAFFFLQFFWSAALETPEKGSAVVKMALLGHVENFWVHGHTLDRMNHMAHFALGRGNDLFDHLEVIISSLVEVSHNPELLDADRNILCRVAELLDVVLSRSHEDLFLPMECTLTCYVPARREASWTAVRWKAEAAARDYRLVSHLLRAYCKHLPRHLLLREHNWLERCVRVLSEVAARL